MERAKSLDGGLSDKLVQRAGALDWALSALSTSLCLLALASLLTPATFGPIGALMLTVIVVGLSALLRVPLHEAMRVEALDRASRTAAHHRSEDFV